MTILGTIGIADKGTYDPDATYVTGNFILHNGSTWLALKDNLTGIEPEEGENWKYLARGFGSDNLSQIEGKDTSGVLGTAGADVVSQELIDAIADRVMTKLFPIANIVNNGLTTQEGFALDARYGKTLKDSLDTTNSNLTDLSDDVDSLNTDVSNIKPITNRMATTEPDNTDYNTLLQPGWYDIYSSNHAPASGIGRVLLRVESVNINGNWIAIQTAIEWYSTGTITAKTYKRWLSNISGTFAWTAWIQSV